MSNVFKNKYGEIRSGWAITTGILFFFLFQIIFTMIFKGQNEYVQALVSSIIKFMNAIALVFILSKFYKRPLYSMGFSKVNWLKNLIYGTTFGFISITFVFLILLFLNGIKIEEVNFTNTFSLFVASTFLCYLTVGIIEETLFRSYIMTALQTTRSKTAIVLISSFLFSFLHLGNAGVNIVAILNIILMGILFTYMFVKTGSIWLPMGFHFAWDFFEVGIYGFTSNGVTDKNTVFTLSYSSHDFITGGAFGPEGGIIVTISAIFILLWTYLLVKKPNAKEIWTMDDNESNYQNNRVS